MNAPRDDFTDPLWEAESITRIAYLVSGDSIKIDGIWWEVIDRTLLMGAVRLVLLRFDVDFDHVETQVIPSEKAVIARKRIWST